MGEAEMVIVADLIDRALSHPDDASLARVRKDVEALADGFPLYQPSRRNSAAA
jgi:glycine/serine hydroxymethyltransferase